MSRGREGHGQDHGWACVCLREELIPVIEFGGKTSWPIDIVLIFENFYSFDY